MKVPNNLMGKKLIIKMLWYNLYSHSFLQNHQLEVESLYLSRN